VDTWRERDSKEPTEYSDIEEVKEVGKDIPLRFRSSATDMMFRNFHPMALPNSVFDVPSFCNNKVEGKHHVGSMGIVDRVRHHVNHKF